MRYTLVARDQGVVRAFVSFLGGAPPAANPTLNSDTHTR